ncbi:methionine-rich copper-binding protein CopC [Bradyrhizobium sp. LB7.2]
MRLLAALLLFVGFATGASAHAALVAVEPPSGSMLASAPKTVELRFNEAVTPGAIQLIDGAGRARGDVRVSASGETISIAMPADLPQGTAVVSYRVISQDGHPVAGSVIFSIGRPTGTQPPANADSGLNVLIWLTRVGLYLGLFVGAGGVFFARCVAWSMDRHGRAAHSARDRPSERGCVPWCAGSRSSWAAAGGSRDDCSLESRI